MLDLIYCVFSNRTSDPPFLSYRFFDVKCCRVCVCRHALYSFMVPSRYVQKCLFFLLQASDVLAVVAMIAAVIAVVAVGTVVTLMC